MDFYNIIIGAALLVLGIVLLIYKEEYTKKADKDDYMMKSFDIEVYGGVFALILVGAGTICRELFLYFIEH